MHEPYFSNSENTLGFLRLKAQTILTLDTEKSPVLKNKSETYH